MPDPSPASSPAPSPRRVLLLGGNGLLGGAFRRAWARHPDFVLTEFSRGELNLSQPEQIDRALDSVEFDLLINAAAYTKVDDAEVQPELAMAVNAQAPGRLAENCARRGARMVHFSTDYVFDGGLERPFTESDAANPLSTYGHSKLIGEQLVAAASPRHLIARLAWLFGQGRDAFPEWLLHKALRQPEVRVVSDKSGSPTWNEDIPAWIGALLSSPRQGPDLPSASPPQAVPEIDSTPSLTSAPEEISTSAPSRSEASSGFTGGIVHLSHGPSCTWLDYAQGVLDAASACGWSLQTRHPTPVALESLPGFTARRPRQSALDTSKFTALTGIAPRPWTEAMALHIAAKPLPAV